MNEWVGKQSTSAVPLNALRAFEVAARHMSIKKAAIELNLTPSAISHRLRLLEKVLGCKLLQRVGSQLELTEVGESLAPALTAGFARLWGPWAISGVTNGRKRRIGDNNRIEARAMLKIVVRMVLLGMIVLGANAGANEWTDAADARNAWAELLTRPSTDERDAETISLFRLTSEEGLQGGIAPPTALAIIACRIDEKPHDGGSAASDWRELEWHMPVECMRVGETLTDAAALNNLWLQQLSPNLSEHSVCAEIGMAYAPLWEAAHKNWAIVKVGCPTKMVDAHGNIVGWHMPECQGTIPGTRYPLRCRFDPSEI